MQPPFGARIFGFWITRIYPCLLILPWCFIALATDTKINLLPTKTALSIADGLCCPGVIYDAMLEFDGGMTD